MTLTSPALTDPSSQRAETAAPQFRDLSTNRLRRAIGTVRDLGAAGVIGLIRKHGLRQSLGFVTRNIRHLIAHRIALSWDRRYGVDTAGSIQLGPLSIKGPNRKFGNESVATSPKSFDTMMRYLPRDLSGYTFIDIGAGKGRPCLLASRYGFDKIIGVEFASDLVEIGRRNIMRFSGGWQSCHRLEMVEADATELVIPAAPLVIFFYNPFAREVFDIVLRNIIASLFAEPRACYIIYASSSHDSIGWAEPAILATRLFDKVAAAPMPLFFDSIRPVRFGIFRSR